MRKMFSEKQIKKMSIEGVATGLGDNEPSLYQGIVDNVNDAIENGDISISVSEGGHAYVCYLDPVNTPIRLCFQYITDKDWEVANITPAAIIQDLTQKDFTNNANKIYPTGNVFWTSGRSLIKIIGIFANGNNLSIVRQNAMFSISNDNLNITQAYDSTTVGAFTSVKKIY